MYQRCVRAPHARPRVRPSVCAGACACVNGCTRIGADRASPSRRRGPRAARLAGVSICIKLQREHRLVERPACDHLRYCVRQRRPCGLHQARRVRQLGVHLSNGGCIGGCIVVELASCVHSDSDDCVAVDGHAEVLMPERLCTSVGVQAWLGHRLTSLFL